MTTRRFVTLLILLATVAGLGWWQRQPILAWWHVRQLMQASEANRDRCVSRVVVLDEAALPRLLDAFGGADAPACANLEAALVRFTIRWKADDRRSALLLEQLQNRYASFGAAGKTAALRAAASVLCEREEQETLPVPIAQAAGELLHCGQADAEQRPQALCLAAALIARVPPGQFLDMGKRLALEGLRDGDAKSRAAALLLTMQAPLNHDSAVLEAALPLLHDDEAPVRRAAILALGRNRDVVPDDDLLPLLHDPDAEVQHTCELALRSRGLHDRHIELARLISDDDPTARLRVLQHLRGGSEVEPTVWLRRLSQDPVPAVRAAAVRAAGQSQIDLRDRLLEMTQRDASPTVRELAAHYLASAKKN